jgi:hypothetical protein
MMTDRDVEELLNRYRPSDPRPELRERITAGDGSGNVHGQARTDEAIGRTWPWAAAAAALLVIAIALHGAAALSAVDVPRNAGIVNDAAALSMELGGDDSARRLAEAMALADVPPPVPSLPEFGR